MIAESVAPELITRFLGIMISRELVILWLLYDAFVLYSFVDQFSFLIRIENRCDECSEKCVVIEPESAGLVWLSFVFLALSELRILFILFKTLFMPMMMIVASIGVFFLPIVLPIVKIGNMLCPDENGATVSDFLTIIWFLPTAFMTIMKELSDIFMEEGTYNVHLAISRYRAVEWAQNLVSYTIFVIFIVGCRGNGFCKIYKTRDWELDHNIACGGEIIVEKHYKCLTCDSLWLIYMGMFGVTQTLDLILWMGHRVLTKENTKVDKSPVDG